MGQLDWNSPSGAKIRQAGKKRHGNGFWNQRVLKRFGALGNQHALLHLVSAMLEV